MFDCHRTRTALTWAVIFDRTAQFGKVSDPLALSAGFAFSWASYSVHLTAFRAYRAAFAWALRLFSWAMRTRLALCMMDVRLTIALSRTALSRCLTLAGSIIKSLLGLYWKGLLFYLWTSIVEMNVVFEKLWLGLRYLETLGKIQNFWKTELLLKRFLLNVWVFATLDYFQRNLWRCKNLVCL